MAAGLLADRGPLFWALSADGWLWSRPGMAKPGDGTYLWSQRAQVCSSENVMAGIAIAAAGIDGERPHLLWGVDCNGTLNFQKLEGASPAGWRPYHTEGNMQARHLASHRGALYCCGATKQGTTVFGLRQAQWVVQSRGRNQAIACSQTGAVYCLGMPLKDGRTFVYMQDSVEMMQPTTTWSKAFPFLSQQGGLAVIDHDTALALTPDGKVHRRLTDQQGEGSWSCEPPMGLTRSLA
ncbi:unnamed protein product [Polarella glacialis]|uniref:Uncharacterized protein n=1 Tax=Polarella glacialis TaxID=89957 RepID=A0A813DR97_POLGL|nr:unnamed protein product [Polarella glacialis]